MVNTVGIEPSPIAAQMFGNAGREHMKKYGTKAHHFAKIAAKNHKHSINNPKSQFQDEYSLEQILASPNIHDPLTKLQACTVEIWLGTIHKWRHADYFANFGE